MSKLEHIIDEIEDYIDTCKFQPLSKTAIIVDRKILDGKLRELRNLIPDELKKYQTIISNKDAILDDARQKAHTLINDAQSRRNELIDEHEVMRQAFEQADEVVRVAAKQAEDLLTGAQMEANGMKEAAVVYTDKLLADVERALQGSIDATNAHLSDLLDDLTHYSDTVRANRAALEPPKPETEAQRKAREEAERRQAEREKASRILNTDTEEAETPAGEDTAEEAGDTAPEGEEKEDAAGSAEDVSAEEDDSEEDEDNTDTEKDTD